MISVGNYVEIKEASSGGTWRWIGRKGHVTDADKYCLSVRADDGKQIRDVRDHFRPVEVSHA